MKKLTLMLVLINAFIWAIFLPLKVLADDSNTSKGVVISTSDYNTAVIGHVLTNKVDTSVLESEMQKLAYNFSLEMVDVLEKNLPSILESLAAQIRQKADSEYKCSLLEDTKIADKECS
jgi:hypothetical protein